MEGLDESQHSFHIKSGSAEEQFDRKRQIQVDGLRGIDNLE
jgi:hypothetical protein